MTTPPFKTLYRPRAGPPPIIYRDRTIHDRNRIGNAGTALPHTAIDDSSKSPVSQLTTSLIPSHIESAPALSTQETETESEPQGAGSDVESISEITRGPKIGVIAGVTVVIVLSLIAIGFCIFDCRRRFKKRKEDVQAERDADVNVWEAELNRVQSGQSEMRLVGLWDKLKAREHRSRDVAQRAPEQDEMQEPPHVSGRKGEPMDRTRSNNTDIKSVEGKSRRDSYWDRHEREPEWLPAYVPRERGATLSSSIGSLGTPVITIPVITRTVKDVESRR